MPPVYKKWAAGKFPAAHSTRDTSTPKGKMPYDMRIGYINFPAKA